MKHACMQARQHLKTVTSGIPLESDPESGEDVPQDASVSEQQQGEENHWEVPQLQRLWSGLQIRSLDIQEAFRSASGARRVRRKERARAMVSKTASWAPLIMVFILAVLAGFASRLLLPQPSTDAAATLRAADSAAGASLMRRRLGEIIAPFRINPLAGQLPAARAGGSGEPFFPVDTAAVAQHGMGAPAARGAAASADLGPLKGPGEAVAGDMAPGLQGLGLGRRLAPGPGPRPAPGPAEAAAEEEDAAIAAISAPVAAAPARALVRGEDGELVPLAAPLRVCLMTADFYGLPNAGPIATAYTLLAAALGTDPSLKVQQPCTFSHSAETMTCATIFLHQRQPTVLPLLVH